MIEEVQKVESIKEGEDMRIAERQENWDIEKEVTKLVDQEKQAEENYNLIYYVVNKCKTQTFSLDDLVGPAHIGLTKAIKTFAPEKGYKFSTYAVKCIQNEVLNYIRKEGNYIGGLINPQHSDYKEEVYTDSPLLYMQAKLSPTGSSSAVGLTEHKVLQEERDAKIYAALDVLRPQEQQVIIMRYGLKGSITQTQREIGLKLGVSQSYVNKVETRALQKLKEGTDLEEYMRV